ncbi:MAG: hypothetical protein CVV24_11095 [Ignavibacteriae bacterium HGW-Ignavibacteriae-3]|nr:MAG: hypothetical protein CVV24_11095 [Ignavibacteriae bacterium HGW-Ignavibacteriae-3]
MKSGKILLLFGSSGDLGTAALNYFLTQNYDHYYIFSRNKIGTEIGKKNYDLIITENLTVEENVAEAFAKVKKQSDLNYFLFSTIGAFFGGKSIAETEYTDLQKMIGTNFYTSFLIAKHFSALIDGTKGGSICFTSASSGFEPEAGKAAYNISKNALNFLVESLALEGKEIGLRANAVAPFAIDTPSNREWMKDLSRLISPGEICRVVQTLFGDETATGRIIPLPADL